MESLLVEEEALWSQTGITCEKGHNIWSDHLIALKVWQKFSKAVFLIVPMESLLVEEEALWSHTGITSEKGDNIWSDRWMELKVSQ